MGMGLDSEQLDRINSDSYGSTISSYGIFPRENGDNLAANIDKKPALKRRLSKNSSSGDTNGK